MMTQEEIKTRFDAMYDIIHSLEPDPFTAGRFFENWIAIWKELETVKCQLSRTQDKNRLQIVKNNKTTG